MLYDLKERLCKELESYDKIGDISPSTLDVIDKLAHTIKNIDKIMEGSSYDDGSYRDRSYGRRSMGRYSRDYSRTGEFVDHLRTLMHDAPDDMTRQEIQRLISKME